MSAAGGPCRFQLAFETSPDGLLLLDAAGGAVLHANAAAGILLGNKPKNLIGRKLEEIGMFADTKAAEHFLQSVQTRGERQLPYLRIFGPHDPVLTVSLSAQRFQDADRALIQCALRRTAKLELLSRGRDALAAERAARQRAEAEARARDAFLATLSHEVRNPLNAILGWARILQGKTCTDEELREGMAVIERNCRAQARVLDQMTDLVQIMTGSLQIDKGPCDLNQLVREASTSLRPEATVKGIQMEMNLDTAMGTISCDAARMGQVLQNLLHNAVKFTTDKGHVWVRTYRDTASGMRCIEVRDSGEGIAPAFIGQVFDPFRRGEINTRRRKPGLGLGLAIVKSLVEMHGGTVLAQSDGVGRGAKFTVKLPPDDSDIKPGASQTEKPHAIPRLDGIQVLAVDDEPDTLRLLGKILENAGATVLLAWSSVTAMEALTKLDPSRWRTVMVADLAMPGEDGFELLLKVRAQGFPSSKLPAVALTAFAGQGWSRAAVLGGFQMYLSKPVDPDELVAAVAKVSRGGENHSSGGPAAA